METDNKIEIRTKTRDGVIEQTVESQYEIIYHKVIDIQDQQVRKALKNLGWISPEGAEEIMSAVNRLKTILD